MDCKVNCCDCPASQSDSCYDYLDAPDCPEPEAPTPAPDYCPDCGFSYEMCRCGDSFDWDPPPPTPAEKEDLVREALERECDLILTAWGDEGPTRATGRRAAILGL
ncbi:MAG: hypothetical protein ACOZBH_03695 [Patescibacteria group bacterium]